MMVETLSENNLDDLKKLMHTLNPKKGIPCVYCGALAQDKEHVIPLSWIEYLREMQFLGFNVKVPKEILVASCHECNCIAGDIIFKTFSEKRNYIKEHLYKKYKKFLTYPEWNDGEIMELDGNLRKQVFVTNEIVKSIRRRLENLKK